MPGSSSKKSSKKGDKPKKGDKANKAQAELAAQKAARKEQARTWQIVDPRTLEANTIYIAMRRYNVWAHEGDESYLYGFMSTGQDGQQSRFMRIERHGVEGAWAFLDQPVWDYASDPDLVMFYKLQFGNSAMTAPDVEQFIFERGSDKHLSEDQQDRLAEKFGVFNSRVHTIAVLHDLVKRKGLAMLGDEEDMIQATFAAAEVISPYAQQPNHYRVVWTPNTEG